VDDEGDNLAGPEPRRIKPSIRSKQAYAVWRLAGMPARDLQACPCPAVGIDPGFGDAARDDGAALGNDLIVPWRRTPRCGASRPGERQKQQDCQSEHQSPVLVVTLDGQTFSFAFDIADPAQFSALLREILDWRMAQYLSRTGTAERTEDVICRVSQNSTGNPILFVPSKDTGGSLPEGPLKIEAMRFRHPVCSYGSVINVGPSHRRSDSRSST